MLVHVNEPMRVAPGGHVIDLKAGETADGSLAEYLVASRCNVTAVETDEVGGEADGGGEGTADGGLSASLAATADVLHEAAPEKAAPVKAAKAGKSATAK